MGVCDWGVGELVTWTPSFETNRDAVRPVAFDIELVELVLIGEGSGIRPGTATITTSSEHDFVVPEQSSTGESFGWRVSISGVGSPFDGNWEISSVPSSTTFTVTMFWTTSIAEFAPVAGATATSPAPAYLRYRPTDTLLSDLAATITFTAESWDYNTIRVVWTSSEDLNNRVLNDVAANKAPRLAVTRSGFGHPHTINDGTILINQPFLDVVDSVNIVDEGALQPTPSNAPITFEPVPSHPDTFWDRPSIGVRGLFDRNLPSGRWFYYSLFVYVSTYDAAGNYLDGPVWVKAGDAAALTPINYSHGERLFNLLPPYYQFKDGEYTAGTGREGVVKRLLSTVGFELDLTRTLVEGVEQAYDLDVVQANVLKSLGTSNFGLRFEEGLGDIRYRSMLAAISDLYDERGSIGGLRKLTFVASKYRCKVIEGLNLLNLPDDSEFSSGTGSWGDLYGAYSAWVDDTAYDWLGISEEDTAADLLTTVDEFDHLPMPVALTVDGTQSVVPRRNALKVTGTDTSKGVLLTCGLGIGETYDRYRKPGDKNFYPRLHGVKCVPGHVYTFSAYIKRDTDVTADRVRLGILWFNEPVDGDFDISTDFIATENVSENVIEDGDNDYFIRYYQDSLAPLSLRGQPHVFAVPYIVLWNSETRFISACMLGDQLNSAASFPLVPDVYLTLGDLTEFIGDLDIVIGGI